MLKNLFLLFRWKKVKPFDQSDITQADLDRFRQYLENLTLEERENLGKVSKREQRERDRLLEEVKQTGRIPREIMEMPCTGFGSSFRTALSAMRR